MNMTDYLSQWKAQKTYWHVGRWIKNAVSHLDDLMPKYFTSQMNGQLPNIWNIYMIL